MKMNKILAAGIAATMAVTSLSAVVSAEEKTFPMAQTVGSAEVKDVTAYFFTDNSAAGINGADVKNWTLKVSPNEASVWPELTDVTLEVTGTRAGSTSVVTEKYTLKKNYGANNTYWYTMEFRGDYVNQAGQANLSSFGQVTGVKLNVSLKNNAILTAKQYDEVNNGIWGNASAYIIMEKIGTDSTEFYNALANSKPADAWYNADRSTRDLYHFLEKTTTTPTIDRVSVKPLSITGAHSSFGGTGIDNNQTGDPQGYGNNPYGFAGLAGQVARFFNKQTNGTITFKFSPASAGNNTSWNNGGIPSTETGLLGSSLNSSAFALFFNYASTTGSLVSLGEVDSDALTVTFPMDEVLDALNGNTIGTIQDIYYGLNNGVDYKDIEILVPYYSYDQNNNLVVETKVEKISKTGYLVESVTLAYDEDAADDTDIEEDDDDDDAPVVEDDDDTTDDVADDDDDATIDEDDDDDDYVDEDDDDDTDVDGDVDEPVTPADDDDDANPGTGVALAVVPALVAAAAVVVSKKRK